MEKVKKPWSKLTFYAMDFGHRITYVTPKLGIFICLCPHNRLLKAHTKLLEPHNRHWRHDPVDLDIMLN